MDGPSIIAQEMFERENAIWSFDYDGDPQAPHAELTGGLCSDGYINARIVLSKPDNVSALALSIVSLARARKIEEPEWVVGSAYTAIVFSYEVARLMGARHGFTQKDPKDPRKMIWKNLLISEGSRTLLCDDIITTFGTMKKMRDAIKQGNPHPVRFISEALTIAYRPRKFPGASVIDTTVALIRREVKTWKPENCPLCAQGSKRIRPAEHWGALTGSD